MVESSFHICKSSWIVIAFLFRSLLCSSTTKSAINISIPLYFVQWFLSQGLRPEMSSVWRTRALTWSTPIRQRHKASSTTTFTSGLGYTSVVSPGYILISSTSFPLLPPSASCGAACLLRASSALSNFPPRQRVLF